MRIVTPVIAALTMLAAVSGPSAALAANTEVFEMIPRQVLPEGELDQAIYSSRGHLALGPSRVSTGLAEKEIWDSTTVGDGTTWYTTGSGAALFRLPPPVHSPAGGLVPATPVTVFEGEEIAFTAMVRHADGSFHLASMPSGRIYAVDPAGKGRILTTLPTPLLWCLLAGKDGALYAGGGPEGVIYRIIVGNEVKVETWFDTRDQHILAMAWGPDGSLWASTAGRGGLYRVEGAGKGRLVTSFAGREVKAMTFLGEDLVLGVNQAASAGGEGDEDVASSKAADFSHEGRELVEEFSGKEIVQGEEGDSELPTGLDPTVYRAPDGTSVILMHPDERQEVLLDLDVGFVLDVASDSQSRLYVAIGGEGQVRQLEKDGHWILLARNEGGMVSTLATRDAGLAFAGSSNPGSFLQILSDRPAKAGTFTGEVLDAGVLSRWGQLEALVQGELGFETRSGNTMRPDSSWAPWTAIVPGAAAMIQSPEARYLQVRALWKPDGNARLQELSAYYLNQNQKPRVESFTIGSPEITPDPDAGDSAEKSLDKALEIVKGDEATPAPTPPEDGTAEESTPAPTTQVELAWSASDLDGDSLVFRLWYRTLSGSPWLPITPKEPLDSTTHTWETDSVPDGRYMLKIEATDERANPPGKSLTAERELGPVMVDNTRPRVEPLAVSDGGHIAGTATDETSPVRQLEFQVDGQEWLPFHSKDGLLDSRVEAFDLVLPPLSPGAHVLAVRATDAKGNVGTTLLVLAGAVGETHGQNH